LKKPTKVFICQSCGAEFSRWAGKCESCNEWNTIFEESSNSEKFSKPLSKIKSDSYNKPKAISEIKEENFVRLKTGFSEFDHVLGGGIVPGSLTLIGGEPGVGKSTLLLEIARHIGKRSKVLYVSGEESASQISMRAKRMNIDSDNILLSSETYVEKISAMIQGEEPNLVFIDSIQTISKEFLPNASGSVTQLRECTQLLLETAKKTNIPIFLIGHITKEGSIAGPKLLEHIVDTVLYFDSDKLQYYRLLRGIKNRFGAVGDIAVFEMRSNGLIEVKDKHNLFISTNRENRIGSVISVIMEGSRSLSVEVQALVSRTTFSQARRTAEGLDTKRLILLAAVLEKFMGLKMIECDIFCNLAGGLNIDEPSLDTAICTSILSSYLEKSVKSDFAIIGEVGLSGEVRAVSHIQSRLKELSSIGIKNIFLPKANLIETEKNFKELNLKGIESIRELESIF
jgi:DNA repair protein RadA/Sms